METGDLLGDFTTSEIKHDEPLKREHDSIDDFEHLEREGRRDDAGEAVFHQPKTVTQSFLDTEREDIFVDQPRAPSVTEKFSDHLADKFTDSESEVSASESPMHRPDPLQSKPSAPTPEPFVPAVAPVLVPTPAPIPKPEPEKIVPAEPLVPERVAPPPPKVEVVKAPKEPEPAPQKEPPRAPTAHVIEAEVIFCRMGLDAWFDPQRLHPKVESLIYWRDPAKSGIALGAGLALLVALACCSVVSVLAYVSLLVLSAAVGFRIYKNVLQAVQKTSEGHPFKSFLEQDISVPADRAQELAAGATAHLNATTSELRRLFLVEDLVDSLKFGVLLWCLTYVGACFNGITLIILGWIALFSLPKAYELNKAQVDANLELARAKINEISAKVRAAVPLGKKSESEKDK